MRKVRYKNKLLFILVFIALVTSLFFVPVKHIKPLAEYILPTSHIERLDDFKKVGDLIFNITYRILERNQDVSLINNYQYNEYFKNITIPSIDLQVSKFSYLNMEYQRKEFIAYKNISARHKKEWHKADMYYKVNGLEGHAKVKIRLKGHGPDHHENPHKSSMRINMKGEKRFLGAKRFSINGIHTRGGSLQYILTKEKIRLGFLTPRLQPIRVSINGNNRGIMYFQEHFSKELVEFFHKREASIIGFDDTERYFEYYEKGNVISHRNPINIPITVYQYKEGDDTNNPLYWQQSNANALMQSYIEGKISAKSIFNMNRIAHFYSLLYAWDGEHAFDLNNIRKYYNPITRKFEPILYDESIVEHADGYISALHEPFFKDDDFLKRIYHHLIELEKYYQTDKFRTQYKSDLNYMMILAQGDQFLYDIKSTKCKHFDKYDLSDRVCKGNSEWLLANITRAKKFIQEYLNKNTPTLISYYKKPNVSDCPKITKKAQSYWVLKSNQPYVRILNISCEDITATKLRFENTKSKQVMEKPINVVIKPDLQDFISEGVMIPVPEFGRWNRKDAKLTLTYIDSKKQNSTYPVNVGAIPKIFPQLPNVVDIWKNQEGVTISKNFITIDKSANIKIEQEVLLPKTHSLLVESGATINIINGGLLRAEGRVKMTGTAREKIFVSIQSGYDQDSRPIWGGILFMNQTDIKHTVFSGNVMQFPNRQDIRGLTSCVTAYKANIKISHTSFKNLQCEDALNVVNGDIYMDNSEVYGVAADALDSDFSTGIIKNSTFINIGNDALDFSGSTIQLQNITATNIGDKGISAGEASTIEANKVTVDGAEYAVASKDKSFVDITNLNTKKIRETVFGAYIKKAEYGVGTIRAYNVNNNDNNTISECEEGNIIMIEYKQQLCQQERTDILPVPNK